MADSPTSFRDPYWATLAANTEAKLGLPENLLNSIVTKGERSNKDQVSEAGAKTVFQIIPATRNAVLKKYGVDAYLNDETAAEAAGLLLKESLERNKGDKSAAVAEYHGGTDRSNWGPRTRAYVQRVVGAEPVQQGTQPATDQRSSYQEALAKRRASEETQQVESIAGALQAYKDGRMPEEDRKRFEEEVKGGTIMLPRGEALTEQSAAPVEESIPVLPEGAVRAYQSGSMSSSDRARLEEDVKAGNVKLPEGVQLTPELGFFGGIKEAITGEQRATPETQSLPEWTGMPELNQLSMASAKTGLGTMFGAPDEIVQVIKANFPNTQVRQDAKGNYLLKSAEDGQEYAIPPGLTMGDIPRVIGGLAAFTPAGRATSIAGGAAASAATQAAIEGSQAATGGSFDPAAVVAAGIAGGIAPPLVRGVSAVGGMLASPIKGALNKVLGREAAPVAAAMKAAPGEVVDVTLAAKPPQAVPPVGKPVPAGDAITAARDATGGKQAAIDDLAAVSAPDVKTLKASEDLGLKLQPDQYSTNQQFIEVAQVLKSIPSSQIGVAEKEVLTKISKRANDLIDELGGTSDLASVSQKIKTGLSETNRALKAEAGKIYDEIRDKLVKTATPAPAPNTLAFVKQRAEELGGVGNLTPGEKNILKVLAPAKGKEPTYGLLDQVRKDIGAAKRSAQNTFGTSDAKLLGDLENVLRADQGAVVNANGLGQKWEVANGLTKQYKGIQDDLTQLFGDAIDKSIVGNLSSAVTALPKGDPSKFIKLIKAVPEDMRQELTASGLATAFSKNEGGLNFISYNRWFEGLLKNKQAYTALMANLPPGSRKSLTDLYRVSKGVARSNAAKIYTGRLSEGVKKQLEGADSLTGKIWGALKYDMPANLAGGGVAAVGTLAGAPMIGGSLGIVVRDALKKGAKLPGVEAAEKLLMSPQFMQAVEAHARGETKVAATKLAKAPVFVDFVKKAKIPDLNSLSARERWIIQALEANQQQSNAR